MNRRGFLKSLGAVAVSAAVPLPAMAKPVATTGYLAQYTHRTVQVTFEAAGTLYAEALAKSMLETKRVLIARILNPVYDREVKACLKRISGIGSSPTVLAAVTPELRTPRLDQELLTSIIESLEPRDGSNLKTLGIPMQRYLSPMRESDFTELRKSGSESKSLSADSSTLLPGLETESISSQVSTVTPSTEHPFTD